MEVSDEARCNRCSGDYGLGLSSVGRTRSAGGARRAETRNRARAVGGPSAEQLRALVEKKGVSRNRQAVTYCQSGVRASQLYFVLRLLDYKVRNYDGSWEDWESDEQRPVQK